ncbi:hypothetical protein FDB73_01635 [Clostridium botulinum]|nr:hypothetical protein [Clostridium botulinum]NFP53562.1 hypothetical protein [Clostridium botulinum]NFT09192.1 hypothetical protein [Clostridium botulinum]NFT59316.1 hypothetical protein [Clostridium botulinum]
MAIKINKKLDSDSTFDPTKESKPVSLGNLCRAIEEGKMTLPIFQTYIRWKIEKSVELLNFQLSGKAAVSPISVNIIENKSLAVPQVSFIERKLINSDDDIIGKESVNDGQQRLSCNYKAYIDHEDFKCIVLDISLGKFTINTGALKKCQIPVGKLYNKDPKVFKSYLEKHKQLQEFEVQDLLQRIRNKFLGYYYTVNYARDLSEEEQKEWFKVLNLAGSTVTDVEVNLTDMLVKGVDYYKEYSDIFGEILRESGLEKLFVIKATEISIPLAALNPAYEILTEREHKNNLSPIPSDAKASLISKLDKDSIRKVFSMTLNSLEYAIDFIESNHLEKPERIDYLTYMLGAFVYMGKKEINNKQRDILIEWYNTVKFSKKDNGERRKIFDELLKSTDFK